MMFNILKYILSLNNGKADNKNHFPKARRILSNKNHLYFFIFVNIWKSLIWKDIVRGNLNFPLEFLTAKTHFYSKKYKVTHFTFIDSCQISVISIFISKNILKLFNNKKEEMIKKGLPLKFLKPLENKLKIDEHRSNLIRNER